MVCICTFKRWVLGAALACLLALGLTACGGGEGGAGGGGGGSQSNEPVKTGGAEGGRTVTVATSADFAPLSFRSKENATEVVGFEVDMLDTLMKNLGWQYKLITSDFNGLIPAVQSGRVNLVVSDVYHTAERDKVVDFVDYLENSFAVLVRGDEAGQVKSYLDLCGKTMGVLTGSAPEFDVARGASKQCTDAGEQKIEIKSFPSVAQELPPLSNGSIDAVLEEFTSTSYIEKTTNGKFQVAFPDNESTTRVGIVVKQDDREIRDPLIKGVKEYVASPAYRQNAEKWGVPEKALLKPSDVGTTAAE
jgi:polar amino acid transport system substrate-binding protein